MNITILGLGYTGAVTAVCLARFGHHVVGVDTDNHKVTRFAGGEPTFEEPGLREALAEAASRGLLRGELDAARAIETADLVQVSVGTPAGGDGRPDLRALESVARQIGRGLSARKQSKPCCIVVRSTVPPGTTRSRFMPAVAAAAGAPPGQTWNCIYSPEFLREGSALADFLTPPQTIIGADERNHAEPYLQCLTGLDSPLRICPIEVAEFVKYACNAYHASKIAFANEIGAVAHALGIDGRQVMQLVCADRKLNVSPTYLQPGNPFGGSCLPKDLRSLAELAQQLNVSVPLLGSVMPSNQAQIDRLLEVIRRAGNRQVGVVGLAFKPGTDDLRESPILAVVSQLIEEGFDVKVFDGHVHPHALRGRNRKIFQASVHDPQKVLATDLREILGLKGTLVLARSLTADQLQQARARVAIDLVGQPQVDSGPPLQRVFW